MRINGIGLKSARRIKRTEAVALVQGRTEKPQGIDPATWLQDESAEYFLADIPIAALGDPLGEVCLLEWVGVDDPSRADRYAARPSEPPPVIVGIKRKTPEGFANLLDGGHRLSAAVSRGGTWIRAIIRDRSAK